MFNKIVTVELSGGLCNILFQIAYCYSFAEKYNLSPVLYMNFFNNNHHISKQEIIKIIKVLIKDIDIRDIQVNKEDFYIIEISGNTPCKYINLIIPDTNKNILLKGYFQSEKYFPKNKYLLPFVQNLPNYKKNTNYYFIHIRMGDYIGHYLHYLGYKNYLKKAIDIILEHNPNAIFLICSNEPDKNKIMNEIDITNNYKFEIDINPNLHPLQTLINMTYCQGGICLNSSFSWFGAYLSKLNSNNNKIFIMPDKWFNEQYIPKNNYKDIYPDWHELIILPI